MSLKKFDDSFFRAYKIDAHAVKTEFKAVPNSRYDIYNGPTVTIRDKEGNLFVDTEMTKDEFIEFYSDSLEPRGR